MITTKQKKLNDFIIKEAGLELDQNNHVFDQDTGLPITVKGKAVKYNNTSVCRLMPNEIELKTVKTMSEALVKNFAFQPNTAQDMTN